MHATSRKRAVEFLQIISQQKRRSTNGYHFKLKTPKAMIIYSFVLSCIRQENHTPREMQKSHCLWDKISVVMQIGFFAILFIYLVRKIALKMCKNRLVEGIQTDTDESSTIRSCQSSENILIILCSSMLLGVHSTFLAVMLSDQKDDKNQCSSPTFIPLLITEIIQVVSWVVTMIFTCRIHSTKIPGILRLWWFCNFLLSSFNVAFSVLVIKLHLISLEVQDYANLIGLLSSTCLLVISNRSQTSKFFFFKSKFDHLTKPLLEDQEEETKAVNTRATLYGKASFLQLVTFSWLNPLFVDGNKKPLEPNQIPDVDINDSASALFQKFQESLKQAKAEHGSTKPSIYKVMFQFAWKKAAANAFFAVVSAVASYAGPYLVSGFVDFLGDKKNKSNKTGYLIALGFLVAKVVETTTYKQWIFGARQLGLRLRAALVSHIYRKGLLLSTQSMQGHTSGEIINYMSVDVQRISDFVWHLNIAVMFPFQISLAMYVLYKNLGLGSIAALVTTAILISCNIPLARMIKRYQFHIMKSKDARMKATTEVIRNIRTIKLQAWDNQFLQRIERLRSSEYNWIWKSLKTAAFGGSLFFCSPTIIGMATLGTCLVLGIPLTAGRVLSALATFRMLQDSIFSLPDFLNVAAQAKVSVDRVASYLQEREIQQDAIKFVSKDKTPHAIDIERGQFSWDPESKTPTLGGIELKVERGMKVAVCGTVGSGKSSLLSAIIGEIQKVDGEVKISGSKAYVPQSPWILTGSVRDNILFGSDYDAEKYSRTVRSCALEKDLELFPCGDLTEIGERGINMSGGQKQRIQIARAVYNDADIYLLDDPFSAVDAHTGTQLFQECLLGMLKDKSIVYVTHQVEFLPAADLILVMQDGKVAQRGTFHELLAQNIGFEVLVGAHNKALQSILMIESSSRSSKYMKSKEDLNPDVEEKHNIIDVDKSHAFQSQEINEEQGRLIQDERREMGSIDKQVYWSYLTAVKGGVWVPMIVAVQVLFQVSQIASNYLVAWACPTASDEAQPLAELQNIFLIYIFLSVGSSICMLARTMLLVKYGLLTAQKLFEDLLHSILRAPMSFFDSTPSGRTLNRVSSDQTVVDLEIAKRLERVAFSTIQLLGTIAVMSQVAWEVFAVFIPVTAICIWYKQYYIPTARELTRISEIQKAPILHHFAESLSGAATIHAFDQHERFISANIKLVDNHSRSWFHNFSSIEWLSFRLNQLSNFVFAFSLFLLVSLPDGIINPSIAGLAVTYGINLNVLQASVIYEICIAENKMTSVERIFQYSKLKCEAQLVIQDSRPPNCWPNSGTICLRNLQIRYAEHLPFVLKSITCTFPGGKKIGVVGRTGSGKSTLIQALFRIMEPTAGSIIIDDVDICSIGLHDLRSRLSIIPQDPTMFNGTVRGNLDPLEQHSDAEIWEALRKCQLGDLVRAKEEKLDSAVVENGENWSVGQRQLLCLGRVLLKQSRILVLDEATASVDSATDGVIQKIINQELQDRTIVTIAHRIHTVIDSDLVLVLNEGRIAEYDVPSKLLEREESFFSRLIREYSVRSKSCNS